MARAGFRPSSSDCVESGFVELSGVTSPACCTPPASIVKHRPLGRLGASVSSRL